MLLYLYFNVFDTILSLVNLKAIAVDLWLSQN